MLAVRRIIALLLLCLAASAAHAADGDLLWARRMGGVDLDSGNGIGVDREGNIYTTGQFRGTVDFDLGPATFNLTSSGADDIFVQKLDENGDFVWARNVGGGSFDYVEGIALDGEGNVYTTGIFQGTVDFDPGADTFNLTSHGLFDIFVQKLDSSGNSVWARSMGGADNEVANGIATDDLGNVYTTGTFKGTADFDPGAGTFNLTSEGLLDAFVQKLDASGNLVWAQGMGGSSFDIGTGIAVDGAGNVYTTGDFICTVDFDPGPGTYNLTSVGLFDVYMQKLNTSGNLVWARRISGGVDNEHGHDIAVDSAGNSYITGHFLGTSDFDPGTGTFNLTSVGRFDVFIQKLDASGDLVWVRDIGGSGENAGFAITVDSAENVYTTGVLRGTADFDPGVATFNLTSMGYEDVFIEKLDSSGDLVWAKSMGGDFRDEGFGVALDSVGNVYTTGYFNSRVDFDPGPCTYNLSSSDSADIFVLKLSGPDLTPPNVESIVPATMGPTNADSLDFTVTFDEEVRNFNAETDLVTAHSGTVSTGATITGGPLEYTVTISGITGDGSFTLAVNTESDVQDLAGNPLATSVTSAAVVIDNTAPTVSIGAPSVSLANSGTITTFPVSVLGADNINLTGGDVTIHYRGTAGGSVVVVDGASETPTVQVSGVTGDGSYTISITEGTASDATGNTSLASGPSASVIVDNTVPTVSIGAPSASLVNRIGTVTFPVTVGGSGRINLSSASVVIDHNSTAGGSVVVLDRMTVSPKVQVTGVTGDGSYRIGIAAGVATDAAGNVSLAAGPSAAVSVDNTGPEFANLVANPAEASAGDTVSIRFDSSEPVVGEPEVKVNGNPATRSAKADFGYEYTVQSRDVLGAATITISGADALGNVGALGDSTLLDIVRLEGEGDVEGEGEGDVEGEGEGNDEGVSEGAQEGEGEGVVEGAGEGEGEGENPPAGCGGCNAAGGPMEKSLGDWLAMFLGFGVLLGAHLSLRSRLEG